MDASVPGAGNILCDQTIDWTIMVRDVRAMTESDKQRTPDIVVYVKSE
ncbi:MULTISPECIES: hypothetical protein [Methylobacterium]|uniref:Protein of unassigned function n=1 Tax=Methylobacterium oryzae CBMB20 TaxID=693986 RepID=A0A088B313_9HYPH|nr:MULTISPECIES: hypothetical protein [Methylobacterium]AGO88447.1 protein of unassigned function [Methylobacterium oryzae CBMB20]